MDSYFQMPVVQNLVGDGVVKILGVCRIYGENTFLAQILPAFKVLGSYLLR